MLSMILPQGSNFGHHKIKFLTSGEGTAFCPVVWELQQILEKKTKSVRSLLILICFKYVDKIWCQIPFFRVYVGFCTTRLLNWNFHYL